MSEGFSNKETGQGKVRTPRPKKNGSNSRLMRQGEKKGQTTCKRWEREGVFHYDTNANGDAKKRKEKGKGKTRRA